MSTITVTWKAFPREGIAERHETSRTIEFHAGAGITDQAICEMVFRDTNLYSGTFWEWLQPLPEDRTHTALSVGDTVAIDDRVWKCADFGFELVA